MPPAVLSVGHMHTDIGMIRLLSPAERIFQELWKTRSHPGGWAD
jgi:hypothetical protein